MMMMTLHNMLENIHFYSRTNIGISMHNGIVALSL